MAQTSKNHIVYFLEARSAQTPIITDNKAGTIVAIEASETARDLFGTVLA